MKMNIVKERTKLITEMSEFMRREYAETMANLILYVANVWDLEPHQLKRWQELGVLKGNDRHLYLQDQEMYDYIMGDNHDSRSDAVAMSLLAMQYYNLVEFRERDATYF